MCIATLITLEVTNQDLESGLCPREMFSPVLNSFRLINVAKANYVAF